MERGFGRDFKFVFEYYKCTNKDGLMVWTGIFRDARDGKGIAQRIAASSRCQYTLATLISYFARK